MLSVSIQQWQCPSLKLSNCSRPMSSSCPPDEFLPQCLLSTIAEYVIFQHFNSDDLTAMELPAMQGTTLTVLGWGHG